MKSLSGLEATQEVLGLLVSSTLTFCPFQTSRSQSITLLILENHWKEASQKFFFHKNCKVNDIFKVRKL